MCPPACTTPKIKTAVSDGGLTGHLISTCLRITRKPRPMRPTASVQLLAAVCRGAAPMSILHRLSHHDW